MQLIFNTAHVIRDDIIQMRTDPWKFEEHLDTTDRDKHIPHTLNSLLRWITQGTAEFGLQYRTDANHKTCLNLAKRIMYQVKIKRQVSHIPRNIEQDSATRHIDPPVLLGTGMKIHAYTRSKHKVDFLHASDLCVDYSRILSIETHLAQTII